MSTISEKTLAHASGQETTKTGDFVKAKVDVALNHDVTSVLAFEAMREMGSNRVWDPDKVVMILDHVAPPSSVNSARVHNVIRDFVREQGIMNFFDVNSGVCHQVLPEHGFVKPGMVVIGADSHTCTHGAFGAFASGVGSTDMGAVLARGKTWLRVPETIKVDVNGKLDRHVHAKDVILAIAKEIGVSGATYMALEYHGETVSDLSVAGRMTLCNMAIEMGGKTGICEPDDKTIKWLDHCTGGPYNKVYADEDANYKRVLNLDVTGMEPQVACPHNVDNVKPVSELSKVKINQAFIGSCTNGRLEDLRQAHEVLKDKTVHPDVRVLAVPASKAIFKAAIKEGIIEDFIDAGVTVSNPSCAACFGGHIGLLGPGEKGIATSNRNFRGRQGSPEAEVYLSSAAVAAASALTGYISHPEVVQ
ncbi:MAG: 3-isopropylmalate dehydratase large subunit [Candidatus Bathyarchaeota archaeon]|nr:3-isopropylmalate dehydratase large subunit [Candidatus Bathyarchaeota archaeon]